MLPIPPIRLNSRCSLSQTGYKTLISEQYNVKPEAVIKMRDQGKNFTTINEEKGKGKAKAKGNGKLKLKVWGLS